MSVCISSFDKRTCVTVKKLSCLSFPLFWRPNVWFRGDIVMRNYLQVTLRSQSVKELWRILLKSIIDSQMLLYLLQVVLNVWTFVGTKLLYEGNLEIFTYIIRKKKLLHFLYNTLWMKKYERENNAYLFFFKYVYPLQFDQFINCSEALVR